jgi:hypothetical protein
MNWLLARIEEEEVDGQGIQLYDQSKEDDEPLRQGKKMVQASMFDEETDRPYSGGKAYSQSYRSSEKKNRTNQTPINIQIQDTDLQ